MYFAWFLLLLFEERGPLYTTLASGPSFGVHFSLYLQNGIIPGYDTTFGNVTAGTGVPTHEATHAWQSRVFGPYFYPLYIGFYVFNAVVPWWLIGKQAFGPKLNKPIGSFGQYFSRGAYPFVPFELMAYLIQGSVQ